MNIRIEEIMHEGGPRRIFGRSYIPQSQEGRLPLVVCAHRYGETADSWESYAQRLANEGFMVHTLDFGGGCAKSRSEGETWEMSVDTEVEDLNTVLNSLLRDSRVDPARVWLMGASQGGVVSALVAAKRASSIKGLVLLFPAFVIPYMVRSWFADRAQLPSRYELWEVMLGSRYFADAYDADYYRLAVAYEGPVLLLHGTQDHAVPLAFSKRALKTYKQAELHIIKDTDHGFVGADFEEAVRTILGFLSK